MRRHGRRRRDRGDWTWLRTALGAGLLTALGAAGVFAAFATAAPVKKPQPTTITQTTTTITQTTVTTTTPAPTTTTITTTTTTTPTPTTYTTTTVAATPPPPPVLAPRADIALQSFGSAPEIYPGDRLSYTDVVTNLGPDAAPGVRLDDAPIGAARIVSATATIGTCAVAERVSCDIGTLAAGSSVVVSITLEAAPGPAEFGHDAHVASDLSDPEAVNNEVRTSQPLLSGHRGAPVIGSGSGAFRPPLSARSSGPAARVVSTTIAIDEGATLSVTVTDATGKPQTLLPGSRIDYVPTLRPHRVLQHVVGEPRRIPLRLRFAAPAGRRYQIVVRAVGPTGQESTAYIGFTS